MLFRELKGPRKAKFGFEIAVSDPNENMELMCWARDAMGVPKPDTYFMEAKPDGYSYKITFYTNDGPLAEVFKLRWTGKDIPGGKWKRAGADTQ
jgi:hypothetical protein